MAKLSTSVLVCARNEGLYIRRTLESLALQVRDPGCELVVIDNASSDDTARIAREFTPRVYRCDTRGKVPSLLVGLSESSSDIIAFADADTVYPPNWLALIVEAFETRSGCDLVFGCSDMGWQRAFPRKIASALSSAIFVPSLWCGVVCSMGFNLAIRRTTLQAVLPPLGNVAGSGWGIGTATLRLCGRRSVVYLPRLQVPKCMRRYRQRGFVHTGLPWAIEYTRLLFGGTLHLQERDYYVD